MTTLLLVSLAGAVLFYVLATRRGEDRALSAVFALLLGPLALPLLLLSARGSQPGEKSDPEPVV